MRLSERGRGFLRALRTLPGLSSDEQRLFVHSWWAILVCRLRLRYPRLLRAHEMVGAARTIGDGLRGRGVLPESLVVDTFGKALRDHVVAVSCLPRSLALQRVLVRFGQGAELMVGMRGGGAGLEGHAWLEREGRVVGGSGDRERSFRRFERAA